MYCRMISNFPVVKFEIRIAEAIPFKLGKRPTFSKKEKKKRKSRGSEAQNAIDFINKQIEKYRLGRQNMMKKSMIYR